MSTSKMQRIARLGAAISAALMTLSCSSHSADSRDEGIATAQSPGEASPEPSSTTRNKSTATVLADYVTAMQGYADCLRQHGIPDTPDPNQFGQITMTNEIAPDQAKFHKAQVACEDLAVAMPPEVSEMVVGEFEEGLTESQKQEFAAYASCMQESGAPDFPDPQANGAPGNSTWDQLSPGAKRALAACAPIVGAPGGEGGG